MADSSWDSFAPSYARQVFLERVALRALLGLLPVDRETRLLDVATGPAVLLAELATRQSRPHEAIGVDSSAEMLRLAERLPDGWRLEQGDATALPYPDESFDVVTAGYLLHVMEADERRSAIAEMARVVRPGGTVGTITVAPPRWALTTVLNAPLRAAAARSRGRLRGMRAHDPRAELESAGLRIAGVRRTYLGYPSLCVASVHPVST